MMTLNDDKQNRAESLLPEVVLAGAVLSDESGIEAVSIATLAKLLGVKAAALYKHVESIDDLKHRIATLAMTELGDALRDVLQGKSGADAIDALFRVLQSYIAEHPGCYSATTLAQFQGHDDPLFIAGTRVIDSARAVLSGYHIRFDDLDHAIRMLRCMIHGYSLLQVANGFHWSNDPNASVAWMIRFVDAGLTAVGETADSDP